MSSLLFRSRITTHQDCLDLLPFKAPGFLTSLNDHGLLFLSSCIRTKIMVRCYFGVFHLWLLQIFESFSYWSKHENAVSFMLKMFLSYSAKSSGVLVFTWIGIDIGCFTIQWSKGDLIPYVKSALQHTAGWEIPRTSASSFASCSIVGSLTGIFFARTDLNHSKTA